MTETLLPLFGGNIGSFAPENSNNCAAAQAARVTLAVSARNRTRRVASFLAICGGGASASIGSSSDTGASTPCSFAISSESNSRETLTIASCSFSVTKRITNVDSSPGVTSTVTGWRILICIELGPFNINPGHPARIFFPVLHCRMPSRKCQNGNFLHTRRNEVAQRFALRNSAIFHRLETAAGQFRQL